MKDQAKKMSKREKRKVLIVRLMCLLLSLLMVSGAVYTALIYFVH